MLQSVTFPVTILYQPEFLLMLILNIGKPPDPSLKSMATCFQILTRWSVFSKYIQRGCFGVFFHLGPQLYRVERILIYSAIFSSSGTVIILEESQAYFTLPICRVSSSRTALPGNLSTFSGSCSKWLKISVLWWFLGAHWKQAAPLFLVSLDTQVQLSWQQSGNVVEADIHSIIFSTSGGILRLNLWTRVAI